jgi:hypothetical protein
MTQSSARMPRVVFVSMAIAALIASAVSPAAAQTPEFSWLSQYGTTGPTAESVLAIDSDAAGNIYAVGYTVGRLGSVAYGGQDIFVRKYSPDGSIIATAQLGTAANDIAQAVFVDATGLYVGGVTEGALGGTSQGGRDAFVLCLDHALNGPVWIKQFGSPASDAVEDIEGNGTAVYAAGQTSGALRGPDEISSQISAGAIDAFVVRIEVDGGHGWTRQFGTLQNDPAFGVAVNGSGVYMTGSTGGLLAFPYNGGASDIFVRKYGFDGTHIFTTQYGTPGADQGLAACADDSGVYIAGSEALPNLFAIVIKLNLSDNLDPPVWQTHIDTPQADEARAISCAGSVIGVAGRTQGALFVNDLGSGPQNAGSDDAFAARIDAATGAVLWGTQLGSVFSDAGRAIAMETSNVIVGGEASGFLPGALPDGSIGALDGFVWKVAAVEPNPIRVWLNQFGTLGPVNDFATSVSAGPTALYVGGQVGGPLPQQTHNGLTDAYFRKLNRSGGVLLTRQFGAAGNETGLVFAHPTGIYVAGTAQSLLPGAIKLGTGIGPSDGYLARFSEDGNLVKLVQFGTDDLEAATGIAGDDTGIYVVGTKGIGAAGDVSVWKFDFELAEQFQVLFGSFVAPGIPAGDIGFGITAGPAGVYAAGQAFGTFPGDPFMASSDGFVRRLDPVDGSEIWTAVIRTTGNDAAVAIAEDATGVYVAGQVQGQLAGQPPLSGASDAFVRKLDVLGNVIVTRVIQSSLGDTALSISADGSGSVFVGGQTGGTLPGQFSLGLTDAFIAKYTADTIDEVWTKQFGTSGVDNVQSVFADETGLFVAGTTTGTLPGETGAGSVDAFTGRIVETISIAIDIKPGVFPNTINLGSGGAVPVAILSTSGFDARSVDPATVTLAGAAVKLKGKGTPLGSFQDVNGDGRLDLLAHVATEALQLSGTDTDATLIAETFDRKYRIRGIDTIRIVP